MSKVAAPSSRILDIGCGTGEDAIWLAAQGHRIHGIDESPGMIEVARGKAARYASTATFECRPLQSLDSQSPGFDVVISNFGALNCVPLDLWTDRVKSVLTSVGRGLVVLMGPRPMPAKLRRPSEMESRGPVAEVSVGGAPISVEYPEAHTVRRSLNRFATVDRVEALGCLVPGPQYVDFARRWPILVGLLAMAECLLRTAPRFRNRGDHTLFEFTIR